MKLGAAGLSAFAIGATLFFVGMYGLAAEASLHTSVAGVLIILVGLGLLVVPARLAPHARPHLVVVAVSMVGMAIYLKFGPFDLNNFRPGWFLWASLPYLVCVVVSCFSPTRTAAIAGVVVALLFDCYVHYAVWHSTRSTAAIDYIYAPIWNTLVFVPLTMFVTWLWTRRNTRVHSAP